MPKFLFLYRGGDNDLGELSPEQMQQIMQVWHDWIEAGMKAGWMVDGGHGLMPDGRVIASDGQTVTDGPFAESKELVGGYSMVQADDLDAAVKLADGCPVFASGSSVEVRQLWEPGG